MDEIDFNTYNFKEKKGRKLNRFFLVAGLIVIMWIIFNTSLFTREFEFQNDLADKKSESDSVWFKKFTSLLFFSQNRAEEIDTDYVMPDKEPNRLNVLILGIRGEDDENAEEAGALLTDTIMVFSHDQLTKRSSLISIPRDLYVKIGSDKNKINSAYEYGLYKKSGTDYVKKLISQITGAYIDNVIVVDFSSFEKLIDQLGGIDVTLAKPFKEESQWGYVFELPVGENHLKGKDALYYARSRYSTSDFDRASRQQQILFAIKTKLTELKIISDPIKILSVVNILGQNIKIDINIWNIKEVIDLGREIDTSPAVFKKQVLSVDNFLYQTVGPNGEYILLPNGDNFEQVKLLFQEILK
ncbi:MAG: hypothetical protein A3J46_00955 [Candidatus Yanofskybacteria bacterium RIFCSPHIGHO2_02_FULL_41_11]|uniref:Cell envelope-related transcriptional attenuator domain-containing protein n=1 Tax=Candidatus Yanofskybacteria bacterium RIFCSPHIGHO2_02_FULL_41_11 TaxID=1802675 RepID=A0A1F8F4Y0_9BACT|nr:MAG: hypothetical protein A3J46_00955 [Candidatus Yanofskybacteria bacterium RIFCSPHIGHO2_02_FULL_41_11]